ncbi:MAG TPA: ester cyclase [Chitinophagaceae bacterium]
MQLQTSALLAVSLTLCAVSARGQSEEENKKVITRYLLEIFNGKKLDLLGEVFPERFVRHDLNDGTDTWMTVADQHKRLSELFEAFPDFYYTIGDIIAEGDKVVVRAVWHGTQKKTFRNIDSLGNRIDSVSEIIFYRLENGKIVERWTQLDLYHLYEKMKGQ